MAKKMLIDATHAEETRVVVVDGTQVDEFDFETVNKRQIAGNIYLAKVTRVEPSLQAAFVDYGGNRHGFLAFAEIHPDYYQIPAEDRRALLEEDRAAAAAAEAEEDAREQRSERARSRRDRPQAAAENAGLEPATLDAALASEAIPGMELTGDGDENGAEPADEADSAEAAGEGGADDDGTADEAGEAGEPRYERDPEAPLHRDVERQVETASERDSSIESVAEEDVAEELPAPTRKPRARRYKIQEVIKVRQIMLVQVVKEERGNKGAALTTYLSLAGRYCVLMPNTARGGGISRKITNVADRKKLKEIAAELEVPQGAGLIIRTAGSQRTKTEIKRDYEYLMRLWEQIRELTFRSIAPAPIYEEGDLIKRQIRDLYSKDIDEILVEGERGYRAAKDFMKMIMPSHAKNVKLYADPMPLFARYQVEGYLAGMFNPVVQLKSGGYIVIGITEALVAIDVNSGRATKEGSIEETAYKTNCEAADEIARQLRLRDLAGLIVIDFIDMDDRKNNANVEKRFKERLKTDRARIQVGRISAFGLLEMSRQRLRPGMLESTTQPCAHCHGTGLIRSDDSMALAILRAIEEEGTRKRSREVLVKAPVKVANFLINQKREHVALIEARTGMSVMIEADPDLISPDWTMEKFKTATRSLAEPVKQALSVDASLMAAIDHEHEGEEPEDEEEDEAPAEAAPETAAEARAEAEETGADEDQGEDDSGEARAEGEGSRSSRRRRRRRRRGSRSGDENGARAEGAEDESGDENGEDEEAGEEAGLPEPAGAEVPAEGGEAAPVVPAEAAPARSRSRSRSRREPAVAEVEPAGAVADEAEAADLIGGSPAADAGSVAGTLETVPVSSDLPEPEPPAEDAATPAAAEAEAAQAGEPAEAAGEAATDEAADAAPEGEPAPAEIGEPVPDEGAAEPERTMDETPAAPAPEAAADRMVPASLATVTPEPANEAPRPKRRGWWSAGN